MKLIRIPTRFFDDHQERELPTPEIYKSTARHYWISADDPEIPELLSDCDYYDSCQSGMDDYFFGLISSARATARAIRKAIEE